MYHPLTMTLAAALMGPIAQAMAEVRLESRVSAQISNVDSECDLSLAAGERLLSPAMPTS